ncbi:MAG: class I SAM-dependent methyltransferase [Methylocystis sp.]|uniref:class I SAM-dependent methyltransferase n=1 Tax=Methylocystis sp. TaxID=1911079 RepID=UPI003DA4645B
MRGAVYYPPCGAAARLLAPVDPWLGRRTTLGAAFVVLSAVKPTLRAEPGEAAPSLRHETPSPESPRPNSLNFYERWMLPPLLDRVMRQSQLEKYRREVIAPARGRVLEIGVGSGLNFPFYGAQVEMVVGVDPSPRLLALAQRRAADAGVKAELVEGTASALPLADRSIDTIVMTWTLCSIPDPLLALREMRRVLKPDGRLLFIEHGLCPEKGVEFWQHRLTPAWRHVSGGCQLDRKMDDLIRAAGFELTELRHPYAEGPRIFTYMYEG